MRQLELVLYISNVSIENFRCFGEGDKKLELPLSSGLTALIGENDTGKTAVVDAIRFIFGTRDQDYQRVRDSDFHWPPGATESRKEIHICCKLEGLSLQERGAFAEFLTYPDVGQDGVSLYVHWLARSRIGGRSGREMVFSEVRSGKDGDGPTLDVEARELLRATYLRPLRDAERELSSGRGSRLSGILLNTSKVVDEGKGYDPENNPTPNVTDLSLLGIGDYTNALVGKHQAIQHARETLNDTYLKPLSFAGDELDGQITVGRQGEPNTRLRQILERLELELNSGLTPGALGKKGLGSNNLLFMACELLLLGSENVGLPLLLIEEPEAHLHPQRQIRLIDFLTNTARGSGDGDGAEVQIIITTHSPNLASAIPLDSLVLVQNCRAFSLASEHTKLSGDDYRFLSRFLDVTKANLFFARGVMIVEGDAENILLPTLAKLIGLDFAAHGVSIVNVGGIGLRRFARIFQRTDVKADGEISVPVACLTDMDVMPDCAPKIVGKTDPFPPLNKRRWRMKSDFEEGGLEDRRNSIEAKANGQSVRTFVSNEWTLEYDLAYFGLAEEVWVAAVLAQDDEKINDDAKPDSVLRTVLKARKDYKKSFIDNNISGEELASRIYAMFTNSPKSSKSITAQYLAEILEFMVVSGRYDSPKLKERLPRYVVDAIQYVTDTIEQSDDQPGPLAPDDELDGFL